MATKKLESRIAALEHSLKKLEEQTEFIKDMLILIQNQNIDTMMGMVKQENRHSSGMPDLLDTSDDSHEKYQTRHDKDNNVHQAQMVLDIEAKYPQTIKRCGHVQLSRRVV